MPRLAKPLSAFSRISLMPSNITSITTKKGGKAGSGVLKPAPIAQGGATSGIFGKAKAGPAGKHAPKLPPAVPATVSSATGGSTTVTGNASSTGNADSDNTGASHEDDDNVSASHEDDGNTSAGNASSENSGNASTVAGNGNAGNGNAGNGNSGNGNSGNAPAAVAPGMSVVTWMPPGLARKEEGGLPPGLARQEDGGVPQGLAGRLTGDFGLPPGLQQNLERRSVTLSREQSTLVPQENPRAALRLQMHRAAARYAAMSISTQFATAQNERAITAARSGPAPMQIFFGWLRIK